MFIIFIINLFFTRNIFNAYKDNKKYLANIFFAIAFIIVDLLLYFFVRDKIILTLVIIDLFITLVSILGLASKSKSESLETKEEITIDATDNTKENKNTQADIPKVRLSDINPSKNESVKKKVTKVKKDSQEIKLDENQVKGEE